MTIADDFGQEVSVAIAPQIIVSLSPSNTEILFALGLEDRVVGVTKYCNYPPLVKELKECKKIEVVGEYVDPDIEKILSLHPDLVLTSRTRSIGAVSMLDKDPNNLSCIIQSIEKIGKISRKEADASKLCNYAKESTTSAFMLADSSRQISMAPDHKELLIIDQSLFA
jgi:iron complex transport system substrate-binding protein